MWLPVLAGALLAGLAALLAFAPIRLEAHWESNWADYRWRGSIRWLGLRWWRRDGKGSLGQLVGEGLCQAQTPGLESTFVRIVRPDDDRRRAVARTLLRAIRLELLDVRLRVAVRDPALTGWLVGFAWSLVSTAVVALGRALGRPRPRLRLDIRPGFRPDDRLDLAVDGIARLRPVHLILAGVRLLPRLGRRPAGEIAAREVHHG